MASSHSGGVNPNASPGPAKHDTKAKFEPQASLDEKQAVRDTASTAAEAMAEQMPMPSVDARREVPRTITDAQNPRFNRQLPAPAAVRKMLSSRMKKDYSVKKNTWVRGMPKTRTDAMRRVMSDPEMLEVANSALREELGMRSQISTPGVRRRIEATDRAIQDFERTNNREHIVYATLMAPEDSGESREQLREALNSMTADSSAAGTMTFDGYIPASHSLGNIENRADIVMEIQTRSGAYLGTSDSTDNADHVVGRGRRLKPLGVHQAEYVAQDGKTRKRWVVQMRDVTDE